MRNSKLAWFRAVIFIMVFIMLNYGLTFALVPKGSYSRMVMREMYSQTKNIDLAFVGASLTQRDINPYIIEKELNCNAFDYAFDGQIYTGTYYSLKELFKYHKPKTVVLTTEPLSYTFKEEQPIAYFSVELYMRSFLNRVQFYFGSAQDGSYLDRLFPWRGYHVKSMNDIQNNVNEKLNSSYISYPEPGQVESFAKQKSGYIGKGAVLFDPNDPRYTLNCNKLGKFTHDTVNNIDDIKEKNVEYLKKISELCKANNSELILLNTPFPTYEVLSIKNYFEFDKAVAKIAKDLNIEYYNYNLIKPELFKPQDDYFMDHIHLNSNGSEAFSKSLAKFLKLRQDGEDLNKYFYTPEEYYENINYITNTWFRWVKKNDNITLLGDAFCGPNVVPEYQFVLTDLETGEDHIIRDYDKNPKFVFDCKSYKKYKIRVNARVAGSNNDKSTRYFEEEISK